jgi:hypothetical protein
VDGTAAAVVESRGCEGGCDGCCFRDTVPLLLSVVAVVGGGGGGAGRNAVSRTSSSLFNQFIIFYFPLIKNETLSV